MALPFFNSSKIRKPDSILAIDLGGRTTKAVHMERSADKYILHRYAILDAPIYEKSLSSDMLTEHLKAVCQMLEARTKHVTVVIGLNDSIVRHAELPMMPVSDMRQILKINPKNYLQQDLPGHVFDCFLPSPKAATGPQPDAKPKTSSASTKMRVLVGGARRQLMEDLQVAIKAAGLVADSVAPSLIGPANAFELSMPEVFARDNVALIDIGFKNTAICILQEGEFALSRVVNIGGDKLTASLAELLSISYAEAEGIKVGMPSEVQPHLEPVVTTLGRELRASIDYFEHQQDKVVSQIFVTGASASSESIIQMLQAELMVECKIWNPTAFVTSALPPQQIAELETITPQLTVAIGAAVAAL
jgi:type IV pilus assembly protein PilM